jgi:PBP1b-binding outer membrane lipoprotein LpoB
MKLKLAIILAAAGMAFSGCNSNNRTENLTDSALADTIIPVDSVVVDTTPVQDTAMVDSL